MLKKVLVVSIMAAMFICAKGYTVFAEELPVKNQPPSSYHTLHNRYFNAENNIRKELEQEEKGEDETQQQYEERLEQEYQARLSEYYQERRTIHFVEKRHHTHRDRYDAAAQALIIHPFDYNNPLINTGSLNYLNALNFEEFADFGAVSIPMSAKEADRAMDNLVKIIGFELIYDTGNPDGLVYVEEKYVPRYGPEQTVRYMDVYLQSVTVYNTRTDEILAQKHIFDGNSPVWDFERRVEEEEDISSTGCFVNTVSPAP